MRQTWLSRDLGVRLITQMRTDALLLNESFHQMVMTGTAMDSECNEEEEVENDSRL
jgi:hypothetical protein